MSINQQALFVQVDPAIIDCNSVHVRPTEWDKRGVLDDLIVFVSYSRIVPATPGVHVFDSGQVVAVTGVPFIRAATLATPPIDIITCEILGGQHAVHHLKLELKTIENLLAKGSQVAPSSITETFCFESPVPTSMQIAIERDLRKQIELQDREEDIVLRTICWLEGGKSLALQVENVVDYAAHKDTMYYWSRDLRGHAVVVRTWNGMRLQ